MNLGLIIVHPLGIPMVFDDVDYESRHCIQGLERMCKVSSRSTFDIAADARFSTNPKEERREIFGFEDALFRQRSNEWNKVLLWGW